MVKTREEWLLSATNLISSDVFKRNGYTVPKCKISIGFTGSRNKKSVGVHWSPQSADDGIGQIYIVPTHVDSIEILSTLVHELVHASVGNDKGHGKEFKKCALKVGLEGKMRSCGAGETLKTYLKDIVDKQIGEIPHAKLNMRLNPIKKQTTRMIKAECLNTSYTVRLSQKWIDEAGAPICPCCQNTMEVTSQGGS